MAPRAPSCGTRIVGLVTAAFLLASRFDGRRQGLWQRLGLTVGHTWIAAGAPAFDLGPRLR